MSTRPAPVKSAKSAKPTKPASEARPLTPVRATKAQEQPPVTTPKGRPLPSAVSSSLRRVHFSPCNEEIPLGVLPQSSPTRAQMRPQSRGILKRRSGGAQTDQQPSSDIDQSGGNGLLDRLLSSPPRAAANGALAPTGDTLQLAHETPNNVLPFDEAFAQAIDGLQLVGSEGRLEDAVAPSHLYNGLCGLLAKYPVQAGAAQDKAMALLDCIQRDVADPESTKQTVLAAVKCLGCALHSESICAGAAVADKLHGPLEVIAELVQHQPVPDKAVCQAAVWCIGMLRASAPAIQGVVPGLLQLCTSVMAQFSTSTTAQFECLSAIEALLRRAPGATRQAFRLWLLPVLGLVATPIAGVRTKACSMIRQNIPWVAADVHGPDMDGPMQDFIATRLSHIITSAARLLGRGDHVLVARIWGMVTVVCARYCRVRLSELLRVIQECFNSTSEDVLVATLMQWRCMIYFLVLENRLHLHRYVQLVLTPIFTILEIPKVGAEVRLACVRCWATLVYALGEDIGTHIEMVSRVAGLVAGDPSLEVREVAARVLAALFNKFVLPEDKTAQFIIPRMIIGTTMLAAGDGKSLSDTHGPFSSEVSYSGDHTAVLCNYVTGLGASSPTVPVVADTAVKFVQQYLLAERRCQEGCSIATATTLRERHFESFGGLCNALGATLAALGPTALSQQRQLATALAQAYMATTPFSNPHNTWSTSAYWRVFDASPHALLFAALNTHLSHVLVDIRMDTTELGQAIYALAVAGPGGTCPAWPTPDRPLQPSCPCALAGAQAMGLEQQLRITRSQMDDDDHTRIAGEAARLLQGLLPGSQQPGESQSVEADDALLAAIVVSQFNGDHHADAIRAQLATTLGHAVAHLQEQPTSPYTPLVARALLCNRPLGLEARVAQAQAVASLGAKVSEPDFWRTAFWIVLSLGMENRLVMDNGGLELVFALCNDRAVDLGGTLGAEHCLGLATAVLSVALADAMGEPSEAAQDLVAEVFGLLSNPGTDTLQVLHALTSLRLRIMEEAVASPHGAMRLDRISGLKSAAVFVAAAARRPDTRLSYYTDPPATADDIPAPADAEREPESVLKVVAAAECLLRALDARAAAGTGPASCTDASDDEQPSSLPWAFTEPASDNALSEPAPLSLSSNRTPDACADAPAAVEPMRCKRAHTPASSDQEDDECSDSGGHATPPRLSPVPKTEPAQTPQRRKRKKRAKRRAPVSRASSPSGPEDAAEPDRLQGLLDQLEAELQAAPPCGVSRLLAVQARIAGMQQRLCEAMQQRLGSDGGSDSDGRK